MKCLESIEKPVSDVPSLFNYVDENTILSENFYSKLNVSTIHKATYCTACGKKFFNEDFEYCTFCGTKRYTYKNI